MPVLVFVRIPDMTEEQYHSHVEATEGEGSPQGRLFHAAHTVDETDIQIVAVWESEEDHQAFVTDYAQPSLAELGLVNGVERYYHPVHSKVDI